ncbi:MAG: hypothetical protein ABIH24_04300 [Verrucomicrobiota bacterium]
MNESSGQQIMRRWAFAIMMLAILGFAMLVFRPVMVPGQCLFTTDDNIGQMQMVKNGLSVWADGNYADNVLLGMPAGAVSVMGWNSLMIWLLPNKFYINWIRAICLGLASVFCFLFLRRQGVGWGAVCMACLTVFWLGSNLTLTYAGHIGKFGLLMVASLSLYCISRALARQSSILWGILTGGVIAFMLMEQMDVALLFGFTLGAYALFLAIRQWRENGTWAKSVVTLTLMGGMPLLISVTMMFVAYVFNVKDVASMQAESPQEKWNYVTQWSWPPDECIDFIAPGYMGWRSGEPAGPYWGRMGRSAGWEQTRQGFMNFKLENQYLGIIPILLAVFAIFSVLARGKYGGNGVMECRSESVKGAKDREMLSCTDTPILPYATTSMRAEILFWGCVALITLLLAFGKFFPLYALFYKLPVVSSIRNPNKFLQVFQLALGILAAYGLDAMLKMGRKPLTVGCRRKTDGGCRITDDGLDASDR